MSKNHNRYAEQPDSELAALYRTGDEKAFDELVKRYSEKIGCIARKYSARGYEQKDFVQEGLMGLLSACKTYDANCGSSFKTYMSLVVERRFISIIRKMNAMKTVPEAALVQIDGLSEELTDDTQSPELLMIGREEEKDLYKRLRSVLSRTEYRVFFMYDSGLSYKAIAGLMDVSEKSVDNALQRARRKIKTL